jgi:hypothetical protein
MMSKCHQKPLTIAICAIAISAAQLFAATQSGAKATVFRLGNFDRSSVEFGSGNPKLEVRYIAALSDPAKDWFSWQPAVPETLQKDTQKSISDGLRTIDFSLESAPASYYSLRLAVLIESASVPAIKVIINGKEGKFYLHPRLEFGSGDQVASFFSGYSSADVEFVFPLHKGLNSIALQAIEDGQEEVRNAGFAYDAIELNVQDEVSHSQAPTFSLNQRSSIKKRAAS